MRHALAALIVVCSLPATATGFAVAEAAGPTQPTIVSAYPNPVADRDAGEFVVVSVPADANATGYVLTDGETDVSLANATGGGTVAIANDPRARNYTDSSVFVDPSLSLSNGGERLWIEDEETVVHERRYRDAPEGEVARWNGSRVVWRPAGATDRPVVHGKPDTVDAFVLPDAPHVPLETVRDADRRILLAGYTFTSERVADVLVRARERGVSVSVLLEGSPVGGRTQREARHLDRLVGAGVDVRLVGGPHARYDFHHPKYAVADDRAIVMTENWKPAGTGGNSSRGWGVVTRQPAVVEGLAATFRADAGWRDGKRWEQFRQGRQFERGETAVGSYPTNHRATEVPVDGADLLVAPDNAKPELLNSIDGASESIDVVQVTLGDWDSPLVVSLRRAAQRGVDVRILLSSAWYAREDNRGLVERFDEWATHRDAPLTAKLAEPGGRYEKIHAKGAVVDDERVVLGSLNWNERAATANREVVLRLHGEAVADFYGSVFDADWGGGRPSVPVGLLGAVAGCLVIAGLVARKLTFER